jgi:hypothetical protein
MGQPSFPASNAIIYLTYAAFLYVGILPRFTIFGSLADLPPEHLAAL